MRILIVLICSFVLAVGNAIAQQPQDKKQNKKGAPSKQGAPQGTKRVAKPQGYKSAGPPPKTAEYGKAKGGNHPPGEYGKVKSKGQPAYANKPGETGKAKGKGQVANANKPEELGKPKGTGKEKARRQPPGAPNPAVAGKPGKGRTASGRPIKPQHFNLPKQPNTAKAPPVKFQQGRHIEGSQHWRGQQYAAFRNYHAEWHDQSWWHHHHNRIVFLFGAPYYFSVGYWFPAWGYYPNAYYAWDGPIYAYNNLPPDQVIANVQVALQQQGYYQGDVDGLVGPLTRAALASYQRDHGLYETAAIDQPTLQALGMT